MVSRPDNITSVPDVVNPTTQVRLSEVEFNIVVGRYLDSLKFSKDAPVAGDLQEFFPLVSAALISRQNSDGTASDKRFLFTEEDPPKAVDTPTITYSLASRVPGRFDQGSAGTGRIKEVTAHQRSVVSHPQHVGEKLVTMGKFYDNWIEFGIYAATNKVATQMLLWFEKLMDSFNWYFRLHGFRVIEEGVGNREKVKIDEKTLTKYPLSYMVRTEDTFHFGTQELRSLIVDVKVGNE